MSEEYAVDKIQVVDRHRKNLGDIDSLIASIRDVGLLEPIVITPEGRLIDGGRRLEACRRMGIKTIPVSVASTLADARDLLVAERDANECREEMRPTEKASLGLALEEILRPEIERRTLEGRRRGGLVRQHGKQLAGELPASSPSGDLRDIIGASVGMAGSTYHQAKTVLVAARDPDAPESVRAAAIAAAQQMDETGRVASAYKAVVAAKAAAAGPPTGASENGGKPRKRTNSGATHTKTHRGRSVAKGFRASINTLIGLGSGLKSVAVADVEPTADECTTWEVELKEVVATINRIRRQLRSVQ